MDGNIINIKYKEPVDKMQNNIFSMVEDNQLISIFINQDNLNKNINIINIIGNIKNPNTYKRMAIMSPNPIDTITSFSGKALPYPCEMIAFDNTPNFKKIGIDGIINLQFKYPNSYYTPDGYTKIISPVIIILDDKKIIIEMKDLCPLKTLRDRQRGNPNFYGMREFIVPIGTAEEVMNNYSYAKHKLNIA